MAKATVDPRLAPAYSVGEAARYLHMPVATLRSWLVGRIYPVAGEPKRSRPLIHMDDSESGYLSFINLVEGHVLAGIRRRHGVKLPKVRKALDYVQHHLRIHRPLIEETFQTDGLDLFVERYGELINASRQGQQAIKQIVSAYLQRIERDSKGLPIKLYPFTRDSNAETAPAADPRIVVMNPTVSFGRPVIEGTGIPVSSIYERYLAGDSVAELAQDFRLDVTEIEEAIRCEAA
jgi:uncharacterized protein (DUF433 family)